MRKIFTLAVLHIFLLSSSAFTTFNDTDTTYLPFDGIHLNFEANLDSLLNLWYVERALTTEYNVIPDSAELVDSYTNIPDSVFIERLARIPSVVDLSYNNVVRRYIEAYTSKRRTNVETMLGLADYYFPIFDDIFDYYGIPNEMKYMAIIESALNPRAYSRARAVGLWQFMYATGRMYGLNVNSLVDDRRDPIKSTHAAAMFINDLYKIYQDWILVIAAYNCGPGNVNRAIRRSGGKTNYWDIYYYLPRETRGHVPAFIAATYVMHYHHEHNLFPRPSALPFAADTVMLTQRIHLQQVSDVLGIPIKQLRDMNPQYTRDIIPANPGQPYAIILPLEYNTAFIDMQAAILAHRESELFNNNPLAAPTTQYARAYHEPPAGNMEKLQYTVKAGDNLGFISTWYNIRISDLRYWNNINRNLIRTGQRLTIYVPKDKANQYRNINSMSFEEKQKTVGVKVAPSQQAARQPDDNYDGEYIYYTIKSGDTLWDIARKYPDVNETDIMKLNNMNSSSKIYPGQKIRIKRKG